MSIALTHYDAYDAQSHQAQSYQAWGGDPSPEYYLKINDSSGRTIYIENCVSIEGLEAAFNELVVSNQPSISNNPSISNQPSFLASTVFPAKCDSITHFFQSLFVPTTARVFSSFDNVVAKVTLAFITVIFDLITLPLRLLTSIPYAIYYQCNKGKDHANEPTQDHKIITYLKENSPDAVQDALNAGKVNVVAIGEEFSYIKSGMHDGMPCYELKGKVYTRASRVDLDSTSSPVTYNEGTTQDFDCTYAKEAADQYLSVQKYNSSR